MTEKRSYLPLSGMDLPRFAGIPTFMRLPHVPLEQADEVQIGLIGVPWDGGTTNRRVRATARGSCATTRP